MALRFSGRIVIPDVPRVLPCVIPIAAYAQQDVRISVSTCCVKESEICVVQGADKTLRFEDAPTADYNGATEITFDIWRNNVNGVSLYSGSLTGGQITLLDDYRYRVKLGSTTTADFPKGGHHWESWITVASGDRYLVGTGTVKVIDTRKYDA